MGFGIAAEQYAMRQDDGAFAGAFEAFDNVQQEGVVTVFLWRNAPGETAEFILLGVDSAGPVLVGEGRIGNGEVECFELAAGVFPLRVGDSIAFPDFGGGVVVQNHVHARQCAGGIIHFLTEDGEAARRLVAGFEQQRAGTAGGVVDGGVLRGLAGDADNTGKNARDFRRGVELTLAFAGLGGEVAHEVFIGIAQQVVAISAVGGEIHTFEDADELGEPVDHLLALAEFVLVVEIGHVDHALEVVLLRQRADDFVDFVTDLLVTLERHHVVEARAFRHHDHAVGVALVLVGDVLHEQQGEHVILVLAGVHAAAQLVTAGPEGGVEFSFFNGHVCGLGVLVVVL